MKSSELNDWLGVVTNIGVIAGLVLVAYKVKQNNVALERQARASEVEMVDGIRAAWQNWEYAIIENREVADIWIRGNAGEDLDPIEAVRYERLASEMFRLISQNFRQYSTNAGEPADWAIEQLVDTIIDYPGIREVFIRQIETGRDNPFRRRIRELDPPELRRETAKQ